MAVVGGTENVAGIDKAADIDGEVAVVRGTENVAGIDEAADIDGGSESWWTVVFAASDKDAFVVSGDVVVGAGETNCWTEVVGGGIALAETIVR